ncbi:MAG: SUMF1/EgtB/PvdO family nonheme iron enzyme [Gammaproteobacteria bacterium]|nr:SUMF1/EgtB/PvdO family nonheme iron enzyme [Pseudomonadales bacterium]MCP5346977.1 SUMF1/EgtB/PvdO family nonheme iron enzyme [Pseudomonadales bacterium]
MTTDRNGPAGGGAEAGKASQPAQQRGARIGFVILAVLVTFVALWMQIQGRRALTVPGNQALATATEKVAGFQADFLQLPDDPLLGMVEIPAGEFLMGSDPSVDRQAYENERWSATQRQGTVTLPDYYIGRFEVTVGQYAAFVQATGHAYLPSALSANPDYPVANVTWTDALAYCRWLQNQLLDSERTPTGLRELLRAGWTVTLPTEAEWEKAARGSDGRLYPWGNRLQEGFANFGSSASRPVGSYDCPDCSYGLSDMSGNVWELTRSPLQPYPYSSKDDFDSLDGDALWVMRGGSYADGPANIRAAVRGGVDPGVRNDTIGFRLVLTGP